MGALGQHTRLGKRCCLIIEVTGTSVHNKGAELMLLAIQQHFVRYSCNQLAVDFSFGNWQDRAHYGLATKVEIGRWGRSRLALQLMPDSFR